MKVINYIKWFIFFFIFLYSESVEIEGITFSQLWKIPLVLFMIFLTLRIKLKRQKFIKIKYWLAFEKLLNRSLITSTFSSIIDFVRFLNFPLLYDSLSYLLRKFPSEKIFSFLLRLSQYTILSSVPFLLGLLEERNAYTDAENIINFKNAALAHTGIFQNAHGASIILVLSLLVILFYIKNFKIQLKFKIFNYILILVGIYALYTTYVRTGYAMFIVGIVMLYIPHRLRIRQVVSFTTILLSLYFFSSYLLSSNEFLEARIYDIDSKGNRTEKIGSGRLIIWSTSLEMWLNSDSPFEYIFGHGLEELKKYQKENYGMAIYSHNGYIDALVQNGLVGLLLFLLYYYYVFKQFLRVKKTKVFRLGLSWLISMLTYEMFQGGTGFIGDTYGALILIIALKGEIEVNNSQPIEMTKL